MLNTSLHNKSARMGGGPFTYEKFVNSLSETIARHQVPDQNIIKVNKFFIKFCLRIMFFFFYYRIFMIILKIMN
jgi:hypothetical protein